jgi:hypothetical protein
VAERRLDAWERIYETRAYLAHGQTRARPDGIVIDLLSFDGKTEKRMPPKHISQMNMLKALAQIEQAQRLMHQQLGHIRALAPAAKPLTPLTPPRLQRRANAIDCWSSPCWSRT